MGGSGVSIWTSKGEISSSSLIIHRLGTTDGGTYACVPGHLQAATITVHVIKGKQKLNKMTLILHFNPPS